MTNGQDIRDARQRAGLTQAELAKRVGVSQRTVGNWERGETVSHNRMARIQEVLSGHWKDDDPDQVGLASASDVELLAEIARRFTRTTQEARHDRQGDTEQGPEAGSTVDSSEDRRKDGSEALGSGAPISELEQRRQRQDEIDTLNFGTKHKPGNLDQGKLQPPPAASKSAAYTPDEELEGPTEARKSRDRGEENQD